MTKYILIAFACLCFIACSKENTVDEIPKDIPVWLQERIRAFPSNENAEVNYYIVSRFKIDGVVYYNISSAIQSCWPCNVFNEDGVHVSVSDLSAKIESVETIWPKN